MKDIIEKLGMDTNDYNRELYNISPEAVKVLVDQRNEMLEALIYAYEDNELRSTYDSARNAIEKATGKSWEEIKELIK